MAGRGVFRRWTDYRQEFAQVSIDPGSGASRWPGGLEVAPDRLHTEIADRRARMRSRR